MSFFEPVPAALSPDKLSLAKPFLMKYSLLLFCFASLLITCKEPGTKKTSEKKPLFTQVTACVLSEITYCRNPQDTLRKYLPGWNIIWNPVAINGNYAFVATDGSNYALAIRGSLLEFSRAALDNWIYQDMNVATQKKWSFTDSIPGAKVSQGAYDGWQNMNNLKDTLISKTLWQFLDSVTTTNTPLYITGHSLGGNLATIYASWLSSNFKTAGHPRTNINVITFAAPAAGNAAFADDFNKKFPLSMRYENTNDMVPKFPVANSVGDLGNLYSPVPAASDISVGYKFLTVKLSTVFTTLKFALKGLEITNGNSVYTQPNGKGNAITIPLSGKNKNNEIADWFAEAGYQHSVGQYAVSIGAPVIK
jgi:triacylglycerol lipase